MIQVLHINLSSLSSHIFRNIFTIIVFLRDIQFKMSI